MPKQIKNQRISTYEKTNRVFAVISMSCAVIFALILIFIFPAMIKDESVSKVIIVALGYLLFTASCVVHSVTAFRSYKKADNMTGLFHGILSILTTAFCLLNFRFNLVMVLSSFDKENAAYKVIGDQTMTNFVSSQTTAWTCMVLAIFMMIIMGILGIIKLVKMER